MTSPRTPMAKDTDFAGRVSDMIQFAAQYPDAFRQMTEQMVDKARETDKHRQSEEYVGKLTALVDAFHVRHDFRVGDLIRWKASMKNKNRPAYGEIIVVAGVYESPYYSDSNSGSAYFKEPLDVQIALLDDDDELVMYFVDSRRFEIANPDIRVSLDD